MLSDTEFRQRLRQALAQVPVDKRRAWNEEELITWWNTMAIQDEALVSWQPPGDELPTAMLWSLCNDLVGPHAAAQP
ncbi:MULTISPECIES: hypothetical protein [Cupriavidus]|uniref:hypothetical protein n=1 Tax=Cupriavidus TaxID=106589 RepID=UPI000039E8C0|nr:MULTISPECIES: hypothetical protein [Cupriavidus]QYY28513.1 hypothetical protein K2O51_11605 [Cupriavidus pinatubonensis]TPQ38043.1 hypothetical protein C2U69_14770 [Cupriavidus pinatubonensis]